MAKRPRSRQDRDHPARRLLTAAAAAFSKRGFDGTSVGDIAVAARVPRSDIYYYFPNKSALLVAIAEEAQMSLHARLDALERDQLPPARAVAAIMGEHVRLVCDQLPTMRVLVREVRRAPPDTPGLERVTERRLRYRQRLGAVIQRGIETGAFAPVDPQIAVEALIALANSVVDWFPAPGELDAAELAQTYARLAVQALRATRPVDLPTGRC